MHIPPLSSHHEGNGVAALLQRGRSRIILHGWLATSRQVLQASYIHVMAWHLTLPATDTLLDVDFHVYCIIHFVWWTFGPMLMLIWILVYGHGSELESSAPEQVLVSISQ